jgi:hypothetical protein
VKKIGRIPSSDLAKFYLQKKKRYTITKPLFGSDVSWFLTSRHSYICSALSSLLSLSRSEGSSLGILSDTMLLTSL